MLFTLPCSSAVEQLTVNQLVVCSIHTGGAIVDLYCYHENKIFTFTTYYIYELFFRYFK